ncbi:protein-arginine deiminase domain-containing protein [Kribbella sp. NBC_01505]|uniref:protein-arginine deiminase family protein n=1 Tax=Kribbella sp. NBC_01505 TaxID=2903580 RepID=UPI003866B8BA
MLARTLLLLSTSGALVIGAPLATASAGTASPTLRVETPGGLFLANLDDDAGRCRTPAKKIAADAVDREAANDEAFSKRRKELGEMPDQEEAQRLFEELQRTHQKEQNLADRELAACNDAADTVVNGSKDALDLARIQTIPQPTVPKTAVGSLRISQPDRVHLFVKRGAWEVVTPETRLTADELRRGAELGIEGRDIIRDTAQWDGSIDVTLTVAGGGSSTVTLHEAPVLTQLNTQKLEQVITEKSSDEDAEGKKWRADTEAVIKKAGVPGGLRQLDLSGDQWAQDIFEPAYTSIPGPGGKPQGMKLLIGSVNDDRRVASRIIFTELAGADIGGVHVEHVPVPFENSSYDSMGNLETIPATSSYPNGRVVIGGDGLVHGKTGPAPEMLTLLKSQGLQDPIPLDTSWLTIGHVDEFIQFVPVPGSRLGWKAVVADPTAGLKLLAEVKKAGHGGDRMHGNLPKLEWPYDERIDQRTTNEFLADEQFVGTNERAAERIRANLDVLRDKAGLTEADLVRVPALYTARSLDWGMLETSIRTMPDGPAKDAKVKELNAMRDGVAEVPGTVNGLVLNAGRYIAPKPFGPVVGGKDVFADAITKAFRKVGYQVTYVNDLTSTHVSEGEIHCATNTLRDSLTNRWWTKQS